MKHNSFLLTVILSIILILTSCSYADSDTNESLTIYMLSNDQAHLSLETTIQAYKRLYPDIPVTVRDFNEFPAGQRASKLRESFLADDNSDLILMDPSIFNNVEKEMQAGTFADLTPFFDADADFLADDYYSKVMSAGVCDNKQYVVPLCYHVPFLLTTERILSQYNVNSDWGSFSEYAQSLSELQTKLSASNSATGVFNSSNFIRNIISHMNLDLSNPKSLESAEFEQACNLYKQISQHSPSPTPFNNFLDSYQSILQSQSIFTTYGQGFSYYVFSNGAALTANGETPRLTFVPTVNGGTTASISYSAAVHSQSKNKQNSYNFIKLLLSSDWQDQYVRNSLSAIGEIPVLKTSVKETREIFKSNTASLSESDSSSESLYQSEYTSHMTEDFLQEYTNILDKIEYATFISHSTSGAQIEAKSSLVFDKMEPFFQNKKGFQSCLENAKEVLKSSPSTD